MSTLNNLVEVEQKVSKNEDEAEFVTTKDLAVKKELNFFKMKSGLLGKLKLPIEFIVNWNLGSSLGT